jgi:hypothetical protein
MIGPHGTFANLVGAHHIEQAAVDVLVKWYPTYLHQIERISGETPGTLQLPRSIRVTSEQEKMPEDQTPCLILRSAGLVDLPYTGSARTYTAAFELEVGCLVSAIGTLGSEGAPRALRLARMHALAVRACIAQQPDDDGVLYYRDWLGEGYDTLPSIDDRTICLGRVRFSIGVPDALTADAGPVDPIVPPDTGQPPIQPPDWPTALTVDYGLIKVPIEEEIT